jgi:putative thioredoxin
MSDTPCILDVTTATFEEEVIEASRRLPVVVDLWAPWCGPCRTLGPVLEKLAAEYGGRFRLAKVNSDDEVELARRLGVRSIPDVRAFLGGEQVDGFVGVLPERELRLFIERLVPRPAEAARLHGATLQRAGDLTGAEAALRQALALDPGHDLARIDLAALLLDMGQHESAAHALEGVPPNVEWNSRVDAIRHAIAFAVAPGDESEHAAKVAACPTDLEARLALAAAYAARKAWAEAMDQLLEIIRRDKGWRDGEARRQMLAIFNLASDQPALVSRYRRKLASALH